MTWKMEHLSTYCDIYHILICNTTLLDCVDKNIIGDEDVAILVLDPTGNVIL